MSAIKKELIIVDVTKGDCIEANRTSGKSNTGTYFVCQTNDYSKYEEFFDVNNDYEVDKYKVTIYYDTFMKYFYSLRDYYNGKMKDVSYFADYLMNQMSNASVKITQRINDTRIFMRFENNQDSVVDAFRKLLYENLSQICIEKVRTHKFKIYPIVNETTLKEIIDKEKQSDLVLEDEVI